MCGRAHKWEAVSETRTLKTLSSETNVSSGSRGGDSSRGIPLQNACIFSPEEVREIRSAGEQEKRLNSEIVQWRRRGPLASPEASLDKPAEKRWSSTERSRESGRHFSCSSFMHWISSSPASLKELRSEQDLTSDCLFLIYTVYTTSEGNYWWNS